MPPAKLSPRPWPIDVCVLVQAVQGERLEATIAPGIIRSSELHYYKRKRQQKIAILITIQNPEHMVKTDNFATSGATGSEY